MKKILTGILGFIFILGLASVCSAEEAVMPKLSFGGDLRIRGQVLKNNTDLSNRVNVANPYDNEQYFRHRTRLWFKGELEEGYTAYVRLAVEPRWGHPDYTVYLDGWRNNIIIDNSYIEAKDFMCTPITIKIGRQDLSYGEGFLVNEGTPTDGSRTIYFDAIKLSAVFGDTSADLFTAKINEQAYPGNDDEDLYGLYITNKSLKDHTIDVYALQREQRSVALFRRDNSTTAIGVRAAGKVIENLTYAVELTKELGKVDDATASIDRDAMGGLAHATYAMPEVPTQPSVQIGAYYTSGDKDDTNDKDEAWDGFYSAFPKYGYGDLLANMAHLTGDDGWVNHMIYELDVKATPIPKMTTSLGLLYLRANTVPFAGMSKIRGRCPQAKVEYQFTKAVSGHVLGQYFIPGDDLVTPAGVALGEDKAFFGRAEVAVKF